MIQKPRFEPFVLDDAGNAVSGANVELRRQGATVNGFQVGSAPFPVNVYDIGALDGPNIDTVAVDGGTTTFPVSAVDVDNNTVTLTGFVGSIALQDGQRLTPVNNLSSVFTDAAGAAGGANPIQTGADGLANTTSKGVWTNHKGFHDYRISGGTITTPRLVQDFFITGKFPDFDLDDARWGLEWDGVFDVTLGLRRAIAAAKVLGADGFTRGVTLWLPPKATGIISGQIQLPGNCRLVGEGSRNSGLKADPGFTFNGTTDSMIKLGDSLQNAHSCRIEHMFLDCNSVANSIGVYSAKANEDSGCFNFLIINHKAVGIRMQTSSAQNWQIRDGEIYHDGSAAIGIHCDIAGSNNKIDSITLNSNTGVQSSQPGIKLDSTNVVMFNIHPEKHDIGIQANTDATGTLISMYGNATVTTMFEMNHPGWKLFDLVPQGSTNIVVDNVAGGGGTVLASASNGDYYIHTNEGGAGLKTLIASAVGVTNRLNNPCTHLGAQTFSAPLTINARAFHSDFTRGEAETVASATTINVTKPIVRLTGATDVDTINVNGSPPGAAEDGLGIAFFKVDAFNVTFQGTNFAGNETIGLNASVEWIWDNTSAKWRKLGGKA